MSSVLLLSGGMDSLAVAWWKRPRFAITVDYGQLAAKAEIGASIAICKHLGIEHHTVTVDCNFLGSGDMAGKKEDINAPASDWWPYRNQLLVTLAGMKAITLNVSHIWLGTVKSDEGHKDGTKKFLANLSTLMSHQEGNILVEAPAINLSTPELIQKSGVPLTFLAWAHSCHKSEVSCGQCRGCNKYLEVWVELKHGMG